MRSRPPSRPSSPAMQRAHRRDRLMARSGRAAGAADAAKAVALAEEALPPDNESVELAEGCEPTAELLEGRDGS